MSPLSLHKPPRDSAGIQQAVAAIKRWTRSALEIGPEAVVSVSQLACSVPGCPPEETVVLVLSLDAPARKLSIHKPIKAVTEDDVVAAGQDQSKKLADAGPPY